MANYKVKWCIVIQGDYMNGIIFCESREEALNKLDKEVEEGLRKITEDYPWYDYHVLDSFKFTRHVYANDGVDNEPIPPYISYGVCKKRLPV